MNFNQDGKYYSRLIGLALVLSVCAGSISGLSAQGSSSASYDWRWGELYYGKQYRTSLSIKNVCREPAIVVVFISGPRPPARESTITEQLAKPLSIASMITIPTASCGPLGSAGDSVQCDIPAPPGESEFVVVITTPKEPKASDFPEDGEARLEYQDIRGELRIATSRVDLRCLANRDTYTASGHVHIDLSPAVPLSENRSPCRDYWETERRPPGLDKDCTDEIRILARSYRQTVLEPLVTASPKDWAWLPSVAQIQQMSIDELLAMKARAEGQRE